jgi:serine/threonine protein kinase
MKRFVARSSCYNAAQNKEDLVEGETHDDEVLMRLVESALAVPPQDRELHIRQRCGGNEQLFERVWHYVNWESRMKGFLLTPVYTPASDDSPFKPDDLLEDRFRIVREVARGGMGIVYEAQDEKLNRRIAIKCAKLGFQKRLPPEVRNAREISHPNVCKIFEIHTAHTPDGDVDFITMEFLDGQTLAEKLQHGVSKAEAKLIARQVCSALAEAHRRNKVIHGDLKSGNIILTTDEDGELRAVVTDFGLARRPENPQQTKQSGGAGGTPAYMAPELFKGQSASLASDVYALGVILLELSAGRGNIGANTWPMDWSQPRLTQGHVGTRGKWKKVIAKCLDSEPAQRFRDAAEVDSALKPSRFGRVLLLGAGALALAIIASFITYERSQTHPQLIRLAVLPFTADTRTADFSGKLVRDADNLLSRVKPGQARLTIIPLREILDKHIDLPDKAASQLGAMYVLSGTLRQDDGETAVDVYLTDARTLVQLTSWRASYDPNELAAMPLAISGIVTSALKLPPIVKEVSVNAAAYSDYTSGVSLARFDADLDRALPLLERAVNLDPDSPLTFAGLADAQFSKYLTTNQPEWKSRAQVSLRKAERRNPDIAAVRVVSGLINTDGGQYEQATSDFLRAIDLEPHSGQAWRWLGRTYESSNQANLAEAAYLKAIEEEPKYFKNYRDLGLFYFYRGAYEDAAKYYVKMVQLVPGLAVAHYQLATPYLNMGRYDEAEKELKAALSLEETAYEVEGFGLIRFYQDQNREAIPFFQRALEIGPKSSLFYLNLGTAYRRNNQPKEARQAYQSGLTLAEERLSTNPRDALEKSYLAYLCARLGDRSRAQAETAQALQLAAGANNVRWMAALTYEALGLHDRTMETIQDAPDFLLGRLYRFPDLAELRASPRFKELVRARHITSNNGG